MYICIYLCMKEINIFCVSIMMGCARMKKQRNLTALESEVKQFSSVLAS